MNYLAHAYLSFEDPEILAGNMISDFVKGKLKHNYPTSVQKGITLHRLIDQFTDSHPATRKAKEYLKPAAGAYAGCFVDIVYDHFLAKDEKEFPDRQLETFASATYQRLSILNELFPPRFQKFLRHMSAGNWLLNYRYKEGIYNSFASIAQRASYLDDFKPAFHAFEIHYEVLQDCYALFIPDIKQYAHQQYLNLKTVKTV